MRIWPALAAIVLAGLVIPIAYLSGYVGAYAGKRAPEIQFPGNPLVTDKLATAQMQLHPFAEPDTAAITGTLNDWDPDACPGGTCGGGTLLKDYSFIYVHTADSTGATLTGMVPPADPHAGVIKHICNFGTGPFTFSCNDPGSATQNQFAFCQTSTGKLTLPGGGTTAMCQDWTYAHDGVLGGNWRPYNRQVTWLDDGTFSHIGPLAIFDLPTATVSQLGGNPATVNDILTGTGLSEATLPNFNVYVSDPRTIDTTAGAFNNITAAISNTASRSAGAFNLNNTALVLGAANGQANTALEISEGNWYFGQDVQSSFGYINSLVVDMSGSANVEKQLYLGGGAFGTTVVQQILDSVHAPTISHGTLDADSSNLSGRVTVIGSNTSTVLTFSSPVWASTARCFPSPETNQFIYVSAINTASATFSCFSAPGGSAANCGAFSYWCEGH
jgi:hypothetical protein